MKKAFPNRPELHTITVLDLVDELGWERNRTQRILCGQLQPRLTELETLSQVLEIEMGELVKCLLNVVSPEWKRKNIQYKREERARREARNKIKGKTFLSSLIEPIPDAEKD